MNILLPGFLKGIQAKCVVHKKRRIRSRLKKMGIRDAEVRQIIRDMFGGIVYKAKKTE